jgi:hypothetical protein
VSQRLQSSQAFKTPAVPSTAAFTATHSISPSDVFNRTDITVIPPRTLTHTFRSSFNFTDSDPIDPSEALRRSRYFAFSGAPRSAAFEISRQLPVSELVASRAYVSGPLVRSAKAANSGNITLSAPFTHSNSTAAAPGFERGTEVHRSAVLFTLAPQSSSAFGASATFTISGVLTATQTISITNFVSNSPSIVLSRLLAVSFIAQSARLRVTDWLDESDLAAESSNLTSGEFLASSRLGGSGSLTVVTPVRQSPSLGLTSEGTPELKDATTNSDDDKSTIINKLVLPLVIVAAVIGLILIIVVVYLIVRFARARAVYYYEEEEEEEALETGNEFGMVTAVEHWFENPDADDCTTIAGEDTTFGGDVDAAIDLQSLEQ